MTELSSLDQKINQVFAGCVVRKDLVKEIRGNAIVPSYVLEYLLGQYCTTSDEDSIQSGIQSVKEILSRHYVHKNEAELVRSNIREIGRQKVIDKISVTLNEKDDTYEASFFNLGINKVIVGSETIKKNPKLLVSGIWCIAELEYNHVEDPKVVPWILTSLKPIQMARSDVEGYKEGRKNFSMDEWIDFIMQSMGLNPEVFSRRNKFIQLILKHLARRTERKSGPLARSAFRLQMSHGDCPHVYFLHLDDHGSAHAAADAQSRQALVAASLLHLVDEGDEDTRAGCADGVTQSDGAAVDVQLLFGDLQLSADCDRLRGERFVRFEQIDVVYGQAGLVQRLLGSGDGADAHDGGIDACGSVGDDLAQRGDAQFCGLFSAHDDQSRRGVVDAGSVGCGHFAVLLEGGLQLGHLLEGSAELGIFVGIEDDGVALLLGDDHGNDLVLELAGLDGGFGLLLGLQGEFVEFFSGDAPLIGNVLSGHAHVILVESVPQTVVDHDVDHLRVEHSRAPAGSGHGVGSQGHGFGTACDDDVSVAGLDDLSGETYAAKTGTADLIDGHCGSLLRETCCQGDLACDVLTQAGLQYAAEYELVDLFGLDASSLNSLFDNRLTEGNSGGVLQGSAEAADGCSGCAGNDYFSHVICPPKNIRNL